MMFLIMRIRVDNQLLCRIDGNCPVTIRARWRRSTMVLWIRGMNRIQLLVAVQTVVLALSTATATFGDDDAETNVNQEY